MGYQAIKIGPETNELHTIRNVVGTPLKTGIWVDTTTDIGRIDRVWFTPYVWLYSDQVTAELSDDECDALRRHLLREATAFEFRRSDWEYIHAASVRGPGRSSRPQS